MPTISLSNTVAILARLTQLHKTVRFDSHTRKSVGTASWENKFVWAVTLEYRGEDDTQINVTGEGHEFPEALDSAWNKFSTVCKKGVGQSALNPPIEQRAIANGAPEATDSPAF